MRRSCGEDLADAIECHLNQNSELRLRFLQEHGIAVCTTKCKKAEVKEESNYFEAERPTPGKQTVTYYQNGQPVAYDDPSNAQYYYSQYNPNFQATRPS